MKKTLLTLILCISLSFAFAQPGSIDTSFHVGTGFSILSMSDYGMKALAIQTDRKIIAAGTFTSYNGTDYQQLVRLNTNGAIDSSYNVGTGFNGSISAIYMLKDTTLLVAGSFTTFNSSNVKGLVKLNKNGTLISSFNPLDSNISQVYAIAVDTANGKIYIGGAFTSVGNTPKKHIARLYADGTLDNTFDVGAGFTHISSSQAPVYTLKVQYDGNILVGGDFNFYKGESASRLCRILSSGTLDGTFFTMFNDIVKSVDVMNDGKIIVGGDFTSAASNPFNKIVSLNADGSLNASFNIGTGISGEVTVVKATPDNKILVGGNFNFFDNVQTMSLVQLNANGSRNANFVIGTGFTLTSGNPSKVYSILVQPDSNVVVGGFYNKYQGTTSNHIVRLIGKGASVLAIPTVTTTTPMLITNNSAKLGGEVTDNGNSAILENGVCWSTSANPTVLDNFASTTVTNVFSLFAYTLLDTTQYHVRAYARNSEGYGYGDDMVFKTRSNENYTCGDVTFTYNGTPVTYGTVKGKYGRCWLDRNLGAARVAESTTDQQSYGGFYQWGRKTDGHQSVTSGTTTALSSGTNPSHSDFITVQNAPFDWTSTPDNDLWNGLNATNNPCPTGWRLPTSTEFANEMTLWSEQTNNGAFESALRLPSGGVRGYLSGSRQNEGAWASCWTSEAFSSATTNVKILNAETSQAQIANTYRAIGANVRCIKDYSTDIQIIDVNKTFNLFPNPANNTLNVQVKSNLNTNMMLSIFDNTGRMVYSQSISNTNQSIDIRQIPSGIYFVKMQNNSVQQVERLIIVR